MKKKKSKRKDFYFEDVIVCGNYMLPVTITKKEIKEDGDLAVSICCTKPCKQ